MIISTTLNEAEVMCALAVSRPVAKIQRPRPSQEAIQGRVRRPFKAEVEVEATNRREQKKALSTSVPMYYRSVFF